MSLNHPIVFGYSSEILNHFFQTNSVSAITIFCDENTARYCLPKININQEYILHTMPAGEIYKNISTTESLWQTLLNNGRDRDSLIINLGGGVVTDLGGFAASCYKRGVKFINIPTSLLAMVDASTGGKTGVNFGSIKNSIGIFNDPEAVIIDSSYLETLPNRHINNGIAEILKHGFIAKKSHLYTLNQSLENNDWNKVIEESIKIKQQVVDNDPYEKGERKILNFGHTIGHAIESYSLKNDTTPLLHGESIAIGMMAEAYLSKVYCNLPEADYIDIIDNIKKFFNTKDYTDKAHLQMLEIMKNDKKNKGDSIRMSLLKRNGEATYNIEVSEKDALNSLEVLSNEI